MAGGSDLRSYDDVSVGWKLTAHLMPCRCLVLLGPGAWGRGSSSSLMQIISVFRSRSCGVPWGNTDPHPVNHNWRNQSTKPHYKPPQGIQTDATCTKGVC